MIRLKNIKKNHNKITCTAFLEDCGTPVCLTFDCVKREFEDYRLPEEFTGRRIYIAMARRYFERVLQGTVKMQEEKLIMWY